MNDIIDIQNIIEDFFKSKGYIVETKINDNSVFVEVNLFGEPLLLKNVEKLISLLKEIENMGYFIVIHRINWNEIVLEVRKEG